MGAGTSQPQPPAEAVPAAVPATVPATIRAAADPDVLLAVLDRFAHNALVMERLHAFLSRHCSSFVQDEHPLVCTQIHQNYQQLFEELLSSVLVHAGLDEQAFGVLVEHALAAGSTEAALFVELAGAAGDYVAFHRTMLARKRQLSSSTGALTENAVDAQQREELRAHIWGMGHRLPPEGAPDGDRGAAAARSVHQSVDLMASLEGWSEWLPCAGTAPDSSDKNSADPMDSACAPAMSQPPPPLPPHASEASQAHARAACVSPSEGRPRQRQLDVDEPRAKEGCAATAATATLSCTARDESPLLTYPGGGPSCASFEWRRPRTDASASASAAHECAPQQATRGSVGQAGSRAEHRRWLQPTATRTGLERDADPARGAAVDRLPLSPDNFRSSFDPQVMRHTGVGTSSPASPTESFAPR